MAFISQTVRRVGWPGRKQAHGANGSVSPKTIPTTASLILLLAACTTEPTPAILGEDCSEPGFVSGNECDMRENSLGDCTASADCGDDALCVQAGTFGVCLPKDDGAETPRCANPGAASLPLTEFGTGAEIFACVEDKGTGCSSDLVCEATPTQGF